MKEYPLWYAGTDSNNNNNNNNSGGLYKAEKRVMFQMQHLQVLFEAACFSEHFDNSFKKIG